MKNPPERKGLHTMPSSDTPKKELFYTPGHEWIAFHNIEAYIGITCFRLIGAKRIKKIEFVRLYGFKKKGDVLANIQSEGRIVQVRMPVDGNIISINNINRLVDQNLLLEKPETEGWLVKILVSQPCQRSGLMSYEQYSAVC